MTRRTQTRRPVTHETLSLLMEQVGVARELVRGEIDPRFGGRLAHLQVSGGDLEVARQRLERVVGKLDLALETLRSLRYDA